MCDLYITGWSGGTFDCSQDPFMYLSTTFAECWKMWITNKLESWQTLKEIVGLPFDELEGNGKFAFMSQKTRLRLFTIDNSFLKTPLKSELNISFWVAPAGNNGTSEKVALFLSIECSKRNSCSIFQSHRSFHSHAGLRGTFSVTGTDVYKRWWRSALRLTSWIGWLPTFVLPLEDATGPKRGLLSFIRGGSKISPNSLPINTPILTKKVPLSYTFYTIN